MSSPASLAILSNYAAYKSNTQPTNSSENKPVPPPIPNVPISSLGSTTLGNAPSQLSIIHNPLPAPPTLTLSRSVLARSDYLRQKEGLPPLETTANLNITAGNYSVSNKDIIQKLQDLKNSGVSTIEIIDKDGKVSTTNAQNITKARYDILRKQIDTGSGVSLRVPGGETTTVTTTSEPQYYRKDDNTLKSTIASFLEPALFIGGAIRNLPNIIGEEIQGKNAYDVGAKYEKQINTQIQKDIGVTYLDRLMSGDIQANELSPAEKVGSLIGSGLGLYFSSGGGAGGGGAGGGKIISKITTPILKTGLAKMITQNIANKATQKIAQTYENIASAFSQGKTYGIDYLGKTGNYLPKGVKSTLAELGIGGEPSGIKEFVPESVTSLERTGPATSKTITHATDVYGKNIGDTVEKIVNPGKGTVRSVTSKPPVPETKTVTGIGSKGEAVPVEVPNVIEVKELQPSETPYGIFSGKMFAATRSTPSELPPQYFLTDYLEGITKEQAGELGLKPFPGREGVYFGKATPEVQQNVLEAITKGTLKVGTDQFLFPVEDVAKNAERYAQAVINPKMFLGENFPNLTRPVVVKFLIGGGRYGLKQFPKSGRNVGKGTGKPFTASDILPSGFGGPGVAGSAARANKLVSELARQESPLIKTGLPKEPANISKESPRYFPTVLLRGRGKNRLSEETVYLAYPPGTKIDLSKVGGKSAYIIQNTKLSRILDNSLKEVGKTRGSLRTINVNVVDYTKPGSRQTTRTKQDTDVIVIPKMDITTGQSIITQQKQTTGLIEIPPPTQTTKQITRTTEIIPPGIVFPEITIGSSGGGTRKKRGTKATKFVYSVNPFKTGAIAEAGHVGKKVGQIGENIGYDFSKVKIKKVKLRF